MALLNDVGVREAMSVGTPPSSPTTPTTHRRGGGWESGRTVELLKPVLRSPLTVYALVHGIVLGYGLWLVDRHDGDWSVLLQMNMWDVGWYTKIAEHGYDHQMLYNTDGTPQAMRIAFFPLLPMLMRYVGDIFDIAPSTAGIGVSIVLSFVAAVGIHRLLRPHVGNRTALLVVALWASLPPSFVQNAGYTEASFVALTAWALVALTRKQWLTAGVLTAVSGLSRSTAFLLVGVVGLAGLIAFARTRSWRPLTAALIAPLGLVSYFVFLRVRLGIWDGWFQTEKAPEWNNKVDFGATNFEITKQLLVGDSGFGSRSMAITGAMVLFSATCLLYFLRERRLPWEVYLWAVAGALFTLMSRGNYSSVGRYMSSYFPLLVPLASLLSRVRSSSVVPVLFALAVSGAYIGAWFFTGPVPP